MHNWFSSYLSDRMQYVSLNGSKSMQSKITYGVPQGSVLGSLLFLIFINDIGSIRNMNFKPKLFADDTNVFVHGSNLQNLNSNCQIVVDEIAKWTLANKLSINYDKTCYMVFFFKS